MEIKEHVLEKLVIKLRFEIEIIPIHRVLNIHHAWLLSLSTYVFLSDFLRNFIFVYIIIGFHDK